MSRLSQASVSGKASRSRSISSPGCNAAKRCQYSAGLIAASEAIQRVRFPVQGAIGPVRLRVDYAIEVLDCRLILAVIQCTRSRVVASVNSGGILRHPGRILGLPGGFLRFSGSILPQG